jgi:hypothetical protein
MKFYTHRKTKLKFVQQKQKNSPLKHLLQTTTHGDVHSLRGARATASA